MEISAGETYDHGKHRHIEVQGIRQCCTSADIRLSDAVPESVTIDEVEVDFHARAGSVTEPLDEFLDNIDTGERQ